MSAVLQSEAILHLLDSNGGWQASTEQAVVSLRGGAPLLFAGARSKRLLLLPVALKMQP